MPSLLLVAIIGVGNVIGTKGDDSILTKFGDGCVRGAWIGFLIGLILIADAQIFASMNVPALGAAMSVCMLPLFYGYTLKLLSTHLDWESIEQTQQIDLLTFFELGHLKKSTKDIGGPIGLLVCWVVDRPVFPA